MRTLAPLGRRLAEVCEYRRVGAYDILVCDDPKGPAPDPGQFYMLAAAERWGGGADERPFLPRAFSVMRRRDGRLEFMLEAVGPGTTRLGELRPGDGLWIAGPFGVGFAPPRDGRRRSWSAAASGPRRSRSGRTRSARRAIWSASGTPTRRRARHCCDARVATDDG